MVQKILKRIKTRMTKPARYYDVGGFRLDMGKNHMLSIYQQGSPLFVRFIPYLADMESKTHGGNGVIVDIGANVGDTVADIVRHTTARIVCVEPTAEFYQLLQKNISNMGEYGKQILPIQAYISNEKESFVSDAIGGTAVQRTVEACAEAPTYTLPDLLQKQGIPLQNISVIKTSTSGNDEGTILSLGNSLSEMDPVLYLESDVSMAAKDKESLLGKLNAWLRMDDYLHEMGYEQCFVFDNFGNFLCKGDTNTLKDIHRYMYRMAAGKSNRTFYYVYILACRDRHKQLCADTVEKYLKDYDCSC